MLHPQAEVWLTAPCLIPLLCGGLELYVMSPDVPASRHHELFAAVGFAAMHHAVHICIYIYTCVCVCVCICMCVCVCK